ncbi:hypothetical protein NECAME_14087 [Necator americanus]|uniref:Neurotransmitter-gated ion-channel ligand-binding domain-containing protein n=1 Tax=Necator americanus TaxID=51031 RepID=W2SQA1_NECAM|nr:hypothetical protein NECAME_14087 [Necator americanus]ETN71785.1 hypothetical protein NECAME_14087 [Necator americanus]
MLCLMRCFRRTLDVPVTYGSSFPFLNRKSFTLRLASYAYPLEDVVYLWANSPPFVNPVEVSNDLLSGPITFEEASAGDCLGNFTLDKNNQCPQYFRHIFMHRCGGHVCRLHFRFLSVVVLTYSALGGSLMAAFLDPWQLVSATDDFRSSSFPHLRHPFCKFSRALHFFFLFRRDVATATPGVCCWFAFCLILTFLSLVRCSIDGQVCTIFPILFSFPNNF